MNNEVVICVGLVVREGNELLRLAQAVDAGPECLVELSSQEGQFLYFALQDCLEQEATVRISANALETLLQAALTGRLENDDPITAADNQQVRSSEPVAVLRLLCNSADLAPEVPYRPYQMWNLPPRRVSKNQKKLVAYKK